LTYFFIFVNLLLIMVNKETLNRTISTRAFILEELRKRPGAAASGETLAKHRGISRVAVWKAVQSLMAAGYPIEIQEKGYCLPDREAGDFLYPWEFAEGECTFRYFSGTDSTMNRAREYAEQGFPGGTVIVAERQSAGRGRNGKIWASEPGGLFFTILERPTISIADYFLPAMAVQIAAARTLTRICGTPVLLRWPNDVCTGSKKIAGILTEISGEGDRIRWMNSGIGVNMNNPAPAAYSTSCANITGHPVSRREALTIMLDEFRALQKKAVPSPRLLRDLWNSLACGIGAKVLVIEPGHDGGTSAEKTYSGNQRILARGVFRGIDSSGSCVIKTETRRGYQYFNPGSASLIFLKEL
jgi:BirA family biotin operon repressor/biotin-[acetyl-CoA-carboxylase] ligase